MSAHNRNTTIFLRVGLAFAFTYAAIAAYITPTSWIGYFPQFIRDIAPSDSILLSTFGLFEITIGLWILSGKRIFFPSAAAAAALAGIVIFNIPQMPVVFRDISIMCMALALAFENFPRKPETSAAPEGS